MLGTVPTDITACPNSPGQDLQNFQATFDKKPVKGTTLQIVMDSTALSDLTFTKVKLVVFGADSTQLFSTDIPFASKAAAGANVHWGYAYYLPGIIPDGTYTLEASYYKDDATVVGCGTFHMSFP